MEGNRHIVVAGCGNTGSHLLPHLARMPGIGQLTLVDPQEYTAANLAVQHIDRFDIGRRKIEAQAAKLRAINPGLEVAAIQERIENVPRGLLRCDLFVSCLDSKISRQYVNELSYRLGGIPWIDCGVLGSQNLARVTGYVPSSDAPCIECQWGREEYALVEQEYPCAAGGGPAHPTLASSALGALAASLMAIEIAKLLSGDLSNSVVGRQLVLDAQHHSLVVTNNRHNPACRFDHHTWTFEPWRCRPDSTTVGEALNALGSLRMEGHRFVRALVCPGCGRHENLLRLNRPPAYCARCDRRMVTPGFDAFDRLDSKLPAEYRALTLGQIGFKADDIISAGDRHYLMMETT
jgi:molybdopterin/thiamine biosynthesis adenylyltransferase